MKSLIKKSWGSKFGGNASIVLYCGPNAQSSIWKYLFLGAYYRFIYSFFFTENLYAFWSRLEGVKFVDRWWIILGIQVAHGSASLLLPVLRQAVPTPQLLQSAPASASALVKGGQAEDGQPHGTAAGPLSARPTHRCRWRTRSRHSGGAPASHRVRYEWPKSSSPIPFSKKM